MTQPSTSRLVTEAANATVSTADRSRTNHTGTQPADTIVDGTTNKAYTAAEKTKLAGVATSATANRADSATDTAIASAVNGVGTANNPVTSASAARPTGLTKVFWQCSTQPTNWLAGDEWINNS